MTNNTKAMTIRMPADQAAELEAMARVEGHSINQAVLQSVTDRIRTRRADPDFQARLEAMFTEDREIFERLAQR